MSDDIRLIHGDCLQIMPTLESGSVDAIITDPPYGIKIDRDGYGRRQNYGGVGRHIEGDDDLSMLDGMIALSGRVLAKDAWLAIFCSPKKHAETNELLKHHGYPVDGEVIWDKASPGLGGGIRYQHETILLCKRGRVGGRSSMFSILRYHMSLENKAKRHPHEKPVPLMAEIVRYCSREGETILDPFVGSGSTLVACMKTGRKAIGIEIDDQYTPILGRRIEAARTPLFAFPEESEA
jgi:site-specific DNA-methyltransferase (adenine-specific)